MRRTTCLILGMALVSITAYAEDEPPAEMSEAMMILTKVDEACKAVQAIRYEVKTMGTGSMADRAARVEATYLLSGWGERGPEKYRIELKEHIGTRLTCHGIAAFDGKTYSFVDHRNRTAAEGDGDKVLGGARRKLGGGLMMEYLAPEPFRDELNGKSQELRGSKDIGGEDCFEIHVVYNTPDSNEATWYFSKKDYLPRGRIDHVKQGNATGTVEKMVTNLVANPEITNDSFSMTVPDGYGVTSGQ